MLQVHDLDLMLKLQLEGRHDEARAISDRIEKDGPGKLADPRGMVTQDIWMRHCFNRGWFKVHEGKYREGCQLLENGRYLNVYGNPPITTTAPIFNPEQHDLKDRNIVLALEGGLGDEIIHARFASSYKRLGANKVYIVASPALHSLLRRVPGVDDVISRDHLSQIPHDYWVPGFSAGWIAGHEFDEDFPNQPYIFPQDNSIEQWSKLIRSEKTKVGIRWAGNPKFEHQQFRLFPSRFLTNLNKYEKLQIYSLQRDNNLVDLPENIIDLQHFLLSWEDTAAAISQLDIVISSCTSVAHLAAAMGKEVWVMVPALPYHTWTPGAPDSTTTPYYESAKIYRQATKDVWNPTFQKMYHDLEEKFDLGHQDLPDEDESVKRLLLSHRAENIEGIECVSIEDIDLETTPWPWPDNSFRHIAIKGVLERLGQSKFDTVKFLQEIYRIGTPGATIEIEYGHHRCDDLLNDPYIRHHFTSDFFSQFDQKVLIEKNKLGLQNKILSYDVDFEILDASLEFTGSYKQTAKSASEEDVRNAMNHLYNVVKSVRLLFQLHKPTRFKANELKIASISKNET